MILLFGPSADPACYGMHGWAWDLQDPDPAGSHSAKKVSVSH
jgi:hypothetical protein